MSANIIQATDLVPVAPSATPANALKEIQQFADTVERIIGQIGQIRKMATPVEPQMAHSSPTMPSQNREIVYQMREFDLNKVKAFVNELLIHQASKLPADMRDLKVSDVIGEKWQSFKYVYNGFELDSDALSTAIATQLIEAMKKCQN